MERIKHSTHVVGIKQTKKAIESDRASLVFVAEDADGYVVYPLKQLSEEKQLRLYKFPQ